MPEVLTVNGTTGIDFYLAFNQIMNPCHHFSNSFAAFSISSGHALNIYRKQSTSFWAVGEAPCKVI